ncbi:MAG: hypothetical protein WDZ63_01300 [Burkholderiales bacterium]
MKRSSASWLVCAFVAAATGCSYMGPGSVSITRPEYNAAIQQTNDRELLLNLVRLRYRDSLYFMNVERVVSALEVNRAVGASVTALEGAPDTFFGGGELGFIEKPTIFYAPLEGEQFVRHLMSPVTIDTLLLLTYSGWSVERVFLLTLQEANGLRNAPTASGPTPELEPQYQEFREALRHLRALQSRHAVEIGRVQREDETVLELRLAEDTQDDPDARAFKALLGLDSELNSFRIAVGIGRGARDTLVVATRPLIATMNYLSQGVEPPPADFTAGRVTRTVTRSGAPFEWQTMLDGLFRVQSSETRPQNAVVAARYRGSWFYIDDSDLDSKSTFMLLSQLFALQAGASPAPGPALNFSIGG